MKLVLEKDDVIPCGYVGDDVLCKVKESAVQCEYALLPKLPPVEVCLDGTEIPSAELLFCTHIYQPIEEKLGTPWVKAGIFLSPETRVGKQFYHLVQRHREFVKQTRHVCVSKPTWRVEVGWNVEISLEMYMRSFLPTGFRRAFRLAAEYARLHRYHVAIQQGRHQIYSITIHFPKEVPPEAEAIWALPFQREGRRNTLRHLRAQRKLAQLGKEVSE